MRRSFTCKMVAGLTISCRKVQRARIQRKEECDNEMMKSLAFTRKQPPKTKLCKCSRLAQCQRLRVRPAASCSAQLLLFLGPPSRRCRLSVICKRARHSDCDHGRHSPLRERAHDLLPILEQVVSSIPTTLCKQATSKLRSTKLLVKMSTSARRRLMRDFKVCSRLPKPPVCKCKK